MLARTDLFDHRAGTGIDLDIGRTHRLEQIPAGRIGLHIAVHHQEADAGAFGIIGGDFALIGRSLGRQQLGQILVGLRHILGGHLRFVVDDRHRFIGGAIGHIFHHGPFGQKRNFRRGIGQSQTISSQFDLQIGGRRP